MIDGTEAGIGTQAGISGLEGARRATGKPDIPDARRAEGFDVSDPQVKQYAIRRRLTTRYKQQVLQKVAALKAEDGGKVGSYLRSEGLYYSAVRQWQKHADAGALGNGPSARGRRHKERETLLKENKALRRKVEQMEKTLAKKEMIIDLQKKISQILEIEELPRQGVRKR